MTNHEPNQPVTQQSVEQGLQDLKQKGANVFGVPVEQVGQTAPTIEQTTDKEIIGKRSQWTRRQKAAAVIMAGVVGAGSWFMNDQLDNNIQAVATVAEPSPSPSPSVMEKLAVCDTGWQMKEVDHGDNNRWFADGLNEIKNAKTPEEARLAALVWHNEVKGDPKLLAGAYNLVVKPNEEADWDSVVENGCISPYGEQIAASLLTALSLSEITPENAPTNVRNTGTDANGEVTVAEKAGISGDRKAIKCRLADGRVVWILGRCGQPAVPADEKVKLPVGPTDEKVPVPLPGGAPRNERGDGGTPEQGMDPQNDSNIDGYGPGDTKPTPSPEPAPSPNSTPTYSPSPGPSPNSSTQPPTPQ